MQKHKGGMGESKLSTRGFFPWFSLTLSRPYIHVIEALNQEYCFPAIKSLPWTQSRSLWSRFPLRSFTTKRRRGRATVVPSCCMRTLLGCCVVRRRRDPWRQRDRQEKKTSERIDHVRFRRKGKRVKHLSKYMYFSLPNWLGKFVFLPLPRKPIVFLPFFL